MTLCKTLLAFGILALVCSAGWVSAQEDGDGATAAAPVAEVENDGNNDAVQDDGGRAAADNDGNDGDDTSIGANPPNALIGCLSPYTYLASQPGLEVFATFIDVSGLVDSLKYRNFTGTLFAPTNNALRNFGAGQNIDINRPTELPRALVRSLIEYHVLLDTLAPETVAAIQGSQSEDTSLSVTATGGNANLQTPTYQLFQRNTALTYSNVTLTVTPLAAGVSQADAPNGTYKVQGGASAGNLIWDGDNEPVRTCVGYVYKIDGVLLPATSLTTLGQGAAAPTGAEEGDGNDGATPPGVNDGENEVTETEAGSG